MNITDPQSTIFDAATSKAIAQAVLDVTKGVRVAQQAITAVAPDNPSFVPDNKINNDDFTIEEGNTKPMMELYAEFSLTSLQVSGEAQSHSCQTLATTVAKHLALAEDKLIFSGDVHLHSKIKVEHKGSAAKGLLGQAESLKGGVHTDIKSGPSLRNGTHVYALLQNAIKQLSADNQAGPFAFFVPLNIYAETCTPDSSMSTIADLINKNATGGYYGTPALPDNTGLLIALRGDPVMLYLAQDLAVDYIQQKDNKYVFRVFERIQYVVKDKTAMVKLHF